eukprot:SAG11_NODE_365_length_10153_cov_3.204695_8_plen_36_part_01
MFIDIFYRYAYLGTSNVTTLQLYRANKQKAVQSCS